MPRALPVSVLHLIITMLNSAVTPRHVSRRYRNLLFLSSISRTFARICQRLLYAHVYLSDAVSASQLCRTVDCNAGSRRAAFTWTKTVTIEHDGEGKAINPRLLQKVLASLPGVRDLTIDALEVDPLSLSICAELTTLTLRGVTLRRDAASSSFESIEGRESTESKVFTWHLPRLKTLTLYLTDYITRDDYFLSMRYLLKPLATPTLTDLAMYWSLKTSSADLKLIAQQLEQLFLCRVQLTSKQQQQPQQRRRQKPFPDLPAEALALLSANLKHLSLDLHFRHDFEALACVGVGDGSFLTTQPDMNGDSRLLPHLCATPKPLPSALAPAKPLSLRTSSSAHAYAERYLLSIPLPVLSSLSHLILPDITSLEAEIVLAQSQAREVTKRECANRNLQMLQSLAEVGSVSEVKEWREMCRYVDKLVELEMEPEKARADDRGSDEVLILDRV